MELILLGLINLFILSLICRLVFKIKNDRFYDPFHFFGGLLITLLSLDILERYFDSHSMIILYSLFSIIAVSLIWETYEFVLWKFFLKKKEYKPKFSDTKRDFVLDLMGFGVGIVIFLIK